LFSAGTGGTDTTQQGLNFQTDSTLRWVGAGTVYLVTTQVFRDSSAWYHVVFVFDTTQATANNRQKIYINGTQITAFTTQTNPTQNLDYAVNQAAAFNIGRWTGASNYFNGYITEVNFIDGLTPNTTTRTVNGVTETILTELGQFNANTGVWEPAAWTRAFGTNGFYLKFADNSGTTSTTLGKDSSGNGNNWTPNLFSVTAGAGNDSLVDSPTSYGTDTGVGGEVRGNYCTLNPLLFRYSVGAGTLTNGNLQATGSSTYFFSTFQMPATGKWYFEGVPTAGSSTPGIGLGDLAVASAVFTNQVQYLNDGNKNVNGSQTSYGASYTTNDVIGVAVDCDAGTITFYKNNASQGAITTTVRNQFVYLQTGGSWTWVMNFGQRAFAYTAPSGFKALCTQNLTYTHTIGATSTTQANDYFNTVLYTGTGSSLSVTGVGFQPDFTWIKGRSGATDHGLYDAVRGVQKQLESNTTTAETTETTGLTAFGSDGFTVGALAQLNTSSATYVGWNWNAGGSNATNTSGTITSTVRANTTSGFSIVTYTGTGANATVGHGLGATPAMIIVKNRDSGAIGGAVYHTSMGATKYLKLFQTTTGNDGEATDNTAWNGSSPTFNTNVFSVGSLNRTNSSQQMVAYCFAAVAGYSAFGSYTGNGSADGPFVFTGFRPRYILVKRTDSADNWAVYDSARDTYNQSSKQLRPDATTAELDPAGSPAVYYDLLSNGFKNRGSNSQCNANGGTYIYMALAESPFKYSLAR
jgi:hypothetical protein